MIKLYQFDPAFGLPNASPFCMKLETWLRMAGLPFEIPPASLGAFGKAPMGKLPYIEVDGRRIADSSFIIEYLKDSHSITIDDWLSPVQSAVALAFQRLMEEDLYWALVYTRWIDPEGWNLTRGAFFGKMPIPLRQAVPRLARRGIRRELEGHGMGRHTRDEIMTIGKRDISALALQLGDQPYFMGPRVCTLDATAYAFLANLVWAPVESELKRHAQGYPQLLAYCARMREGYYPGVTA